MLFFLHAHLSPTTQGCDIRVVCLFAASEHSTAVCVDTVRQACRYEEPHRHLVINLKAVYVLSVDDRAAASDHWRRHFKLPPSVSFDPFLSNR